MSPPFAEVHGQRFQFEGTIAIGFEDDKTVLSSKNVKTTKALQNLVARYPNADITLKEEEKGDLTVNGIPINEHTVDSHYVKIAETESTNTST